MPCPGVASGLRAVGFFGCLIDVCPALVVVFLSSFPPYSFFFRLFWGVSSVGRASGSHPEGQGFKSPTLHQYSSRFLPLILENIPRKLTFWNNFGTLSFEEWRVSSGGVPMATFDKRGDLQWRDQIRRKGYPVQRKTFNSRAEAEAWAAVVESEMARGIFVSRAEAEKNYPGRSFRSM